MSPKLIGFDFESSGLSIVHDKPVQACLVLRQDSVDRVLMNTLVNPCKPIAPEASNVHKIYDHQVKSMPDYAMIAWQMQLLGEQIGEYVLVTFNGHSFDVPMANNCLGAPVFNAPHIDVLRFARHHFPEVRGTRSKGGKTLGELYELFCNKPLSGAHDAAVDVIGTLDLLDAMRIKAGATYERLIEEQSKPLPYTVMPFGKYAGQPRTSVPESYAKWMRDNAEQKGEPLDADLKATVDAILGG
jgi:DNA polymerase III epsilon subunit-like protein